MSIYHYIYQIANKTNGRIYIGVRQSKIIPEDDTKYMGSSKILKHAIQKHGIQQFEKTIITLYDTRKEALAAEAFIVNADFVLREDTYNLTLGGFGGTVKGGSHSEETKQKIAASLKGRPRSKETIRKYSDSLRGRNLSVEHKRKIGETLKGGTHSEETKKKRSESNRGKTRSEEHKRKISAACKGRPGKSHSEETKRKISESKLGKICPEETKRKISETLKLRNAQKTD